MPRNWLEEKTCWKSWGGTSEKTGVQGGERGRQGPTEVLGKQTTEGEKVARCTP